MTWPVLGFFNTSTGKKVGMGVTGFVVVGFVIAHMAGNLQVFMGPEKLNQYAAFLVSLGGLLWVLRGIILLAAVLHVIFATQVTLQSWRARPSSYAVYRYQASSYAARTMRLGGPMLALFIIYHLLHLTFGVVQPAGEAFDPHHVYNNVVYGFQVWWLSALYIVAMGLLALHIWHGVSSMLQSVGLNHPKWNPWRFGLSALVAGAVALGNISMPLAVLAGLIQPA